MIFRDHYVENTLGFLLGAHRAGIPAEWVSALAKGDQTRNRDRVHATLLEHGFASGVLDNTTLNAPAEHALELAQGLAGVEEFIDAAHAAGRKVLVIDDGGLLAHGYGRGDAPRCVEGALELTVSGLKRIAAAGPLGIPVFNLASSQLKTRLGYPEIADSCLRRLRQLLPTHKVIGRPVLLIGFGMLGSRLAAALPDGVLLAPFATKDFSLLAEPPHAAAVTDIPGVGRHYHFPPDAGTRPRPNRYCGPVSSATGSRVACTPRSSPITALR